MRICYCFPSRTRAYKFYQTLDNIREMSDSADYFVWGKIDEDDPQLEKYKLLAPFYPELHIQYGLSNNKIHAVNRSMDNLPHCDIIIIMSDDIRWDIKGFDTEIRRAFSRHCPTLDSTIHFPDDHGKMSTIIVSIMGVNLYKRLGYLYHPDFISVYADNHFTELCRKIGKYFYINKRLFSHLHPMWKLSQWDQLYRETESKENYEKDRATFLELKEKNFGL